MADMLKVCIERRYRKDSGLLVVREAPARAACHMSPDRDPPPDPDRYLYELTDQLPLITAER